MTGTATPAPPSLHQGPGPDTRRALGATLLGIWRQRHLVYLLTRREIARQFRGSVMGWFWLVLAPVILLLIYWLIFATIFGIGDEATRSGRTSYPLLIFAGISVFQVFGECLQRGPGLIREHPNYVQRVVFPVELLAVVAVSSALFKAVISLTLLILILAVSGDWPGHTLWLLPVILVPWALLMVGMVWMLSALGAFVRDIGNLLASITIVLVLGSPVFYDIERIPEAFRALYLANPIAGYIAMARDVLLWREPPSPWLFAGHAALALIVLWAGHRVFFRLRKQFADVV